MWYVICTVVYFPSDDFKSVVVHYIAKKFQSKHFGMRDETINLLAFSVLIFGRNLNLNMVKCVTLTGYRIIIQLFRQ